jgi:hypothetical protein
MKTWEDLRCVLEIDSQQDLENVSAAVIIKTLTGTRLITSWTDEIEFKYRLKKGIQTLECCFHRLPIRPGRQVVIELWLYDGSVLDSIEAARVMEVTEGDPCGFSLRSDQGAVLCNYEWKAS